MKLVFKTDPDLSFLHAIAVVATTGATIDEKLEAAVREPAAVINERLELAELSVGNFWQSLVAGPASHDSARIELARIERSLMAAGCAELGIDSLSPVVSGRLADARLAFRERFPKLADQLPLRARPLKELWEATGPGTLRQIARRTVDTLIPPKTTLHLLQPVSGGGGGLLEETPAVWLEAVLAHPDPTIPETLRIAWLVARKGVDQGNQTHLEDPHRWRQVAALALVPIVLAAGAELGVCEASEARLAAAAQLWADLEDVEPLLKWWQEMQQQQLPLPIAIKALDKMMG